MASKDLSKPLCVCLNDGILQRIHWFDTKNYINIKRNSSKNYQQNDIFKCFFYINTVRTVTNGDPSLLGSWVSKASIFNRGVTANVQGPTDSKDVALGQRPGTDMFGSFWK